MSNGQTYEVICRQGRSRLECPIRKQNGSYCVECPYAVYRLREKTVKSETSETSETSEINES